MPSAARTMTQPMKGIIEGSKSLDMVPRGLHLIHYSRLIGRFRSGPIQSAYRGRPRSSYVVAERESASSSAAPRSTIEAVSPSRSSVDAAAAGSQSSRRSQELKSCPERPNIAQSPASRYGPEGRQGHVRRHAQAAAHGKEFAYQ